MTVQAVSAPPIVTLRRATPADAALLHAWRAEPAARRFQPILQRGSAELQEPLRAREAVVVRRGTGGEVQWIVEAAGEPVGWVKIDVHSPSHGVGELGYTLATAHHRRGLMLPAVRLALAVGFDAVDGLALARIEARAALANRASRSILARAGFTQEGVVRESAIIDGERVDHALYGLLRREWIKSMEAAS